MAWIVKVHTSANGPVKYDFRTVKAGSHKAALEQAIILAAGDVASWQYLNRIGPDGTPDKLAREQNMRAMLDLISTLQRELHKPANKRWYRGPSCTRFEFEAGRLAWATFERS